MTVKPIVAGTDGSEESLRAVEWAAREAVLRKAALRIVSVPVLSAHILGDEAGHEMVTGAITDAALDALASAVGRATDLEPDLVVDTDLPISGPPAEVLLELSAGASMLVLGSHGAGTLSAALPGSVSRFVVTRAYCPVVIAGEDTMAVPGEIVVGVRDPDHSAAALAFAFEEAALRKARLLAVHAWFWFLPGVQQAGVLTGPQRAALDRRDLSADAATALEDVLAPWREKYPEVEAGWEVMHAQPARALASKSAQAGLLVLGRDQDGLVAGSVTHAVLGRAHGPVVTVPADWSP